jgi:2-polyprenyl-3-methyl-5-hydroxy-6-metoxy-1,4-benzoquinol methylase
MLTTRSKEKELLDLGADFYSKEEYSHCLKLLFNINKLLGIFKDTIKVLKRFPKDSSLLDIGCGGGLFLLNLNKIYPYMQMVGVDISSEAIALAKCELAKSHEKLNIDFQLQHQEALQLSKNSVDIILLTLVCHHLDDDKLIEFLKNTVNAARKAVIINDLHRHSLACWFYTLLSPVFRNRLITHDGLISIQRGFTRRELHYLIKQANIQHYQIKWCFPFRWLVILRGDNDL